MLKFVALLLNDNRWFRWLFQVTRQREDYWLDLFIGNLISGETPPVFDAIILQEFDREAELQHKEERMEYLARTYSAKRRPVTVAPHDDRFDTYQAIILQLGSYTPYKLYILADNSKGRADQRPKLAPGTKLQCYLYRLQKRSMYVLLPVQAVAQNQVPNDIADDIIKPDGAAKFPKSPATSVMDSVTPYDKGDNREEGKREKKWKQASLRTFNNDYAADEDDDMTGADGDPDDDQEFDQLI